MSDKLDLDKLADLQFGAYASTGLPQAIAELKLLRTTLESDAIARREEERDDWRTACQNKAADLNAWEAIAKEFDVPKWDGCAYSDESGWARRVFGAVVKERDEARAEIERLRKLLERARAFMIYDPSAANDNRFALANDINAALAAKGAS